MLHVHAVCLAFLLLCAVPFTSVQASSHQPMLASVYSGDGEVADYWVSEKLDGVRGYWDGARLWTRGGYPIAAPAWFTQDWPSHPMEGELWIGRELFDTVSGIVRSNEPEDAQWRRIRFMVFDLPEHGGTFGQRVQAMRAIADYRIAWLQPVPQFRVKGARELDALLQSMVAAGSEGLMLHHQDAPYRSGRSQDLLKYKTYDDAEARVMGYTAGKGKYTGQVGALVVECEDGRRFRLGSGLSDADRANPPPIGSWVTYRYNGLTSRGLPRFARFVRVRTDMPEERLAATRAGDDVQPAP